MTATTARPRSPLLAIVTYTVRTAIHGRRWLAVLVPMVASAVLGMLSVGQGGDLRDFATVATEGLFGLVMPVACLVIGDSVLGAEIRSGTFAFTWLSPVPTWQIAVGRWIGGSIVAGVSLAASFALAAVIGGGSSTLGPLVVATLAGSFAYTALFLAVGSIARRAAVWSLAYVFLVEGLLGSALSGIAQLTPGWVTPAAYLGLADIDFDLVREGVPHGGGALVRLALIAVVGLVITSRRLRSIRLSGASD